jgi:alkylhydroperoxidase family enzyme
MVHRETDFDQVFGMRPNLHTAYRDFVTRLWVPAVLDPAVTELLRVRIAQLHEDDAELAVRTRAALVAGFNECKIGRLARGSDDIAFNQIEQACLLYAEQFVLDPAGITDADRARLTELIGAAQLVGLTNICAVFDGFSRFRVVLGVRPSNTGVVDLPGLDPDAPLLPPPLDPHDPVAASPLALQPDLLASFQRLYAVLWNEGVVDHPAKEVARLRNARVTGCRFCRNVRFDQARADGLTEDLVELINEGFEASKLEERHKTVIRLADVFLGNPHGMTPELRAEVDAAYGEAGTVELTAGLALFMGFSKIAVASGTMPDDFPAMVIPTPQ